MNLQTLAAKIVIVAELKGQFTLRSGATSTTYFDKYQFEARPDLLNDICQALALQVPNDTQVLAGLEMGGIPIATLLSQITGLPTAFIRKTEKRYGTCLYAEGYPLASNSILLIEDVVSSGGAISDAASKLRADGIEISKALCVIDRETGGSEKLAAEGIDLMSLFAQSELSN